MKPSTSVVFSPEDIARFQIASREVLESGVLTLGERTANFEREFAARHHARYAVAVASASAALVVALRAAGIGSGDKVLVPTNTFFATVSAVVHVGGRPVFSDVSPRTGMMTAHDLRLAFRTHDDIRAVISVDIGGAANPEAGGIFDLCDGNNLALVSDSSHSTGIDNKVDLRCYSLFPTKLVTCGEGGVVVTNSDELAERCRSIRNHGKNQSAFNLHEEMGFNWRMSEITAALANIHLWHLGEFVFVRNAVAGFYDNFFRDIAVVQDSPSNYYKYIVMPPSADARKDLVSRLSAAGFQLPGRVFDVPLHKQPVFSDHPQARCKFPGAMDFCDRHLCLPMRSDMGIDEAEEVVKIAKEALCA